MTHADVARWFKNRSSDRSVRESADRCGTSYRSPVGLSLRFCRSREICSELVRTLMRSGVFFRTLGNAPGFRSTSVLVLCRNSGRSLLAVSLDFHMVQSGAPPTSPVRLSAFLSIACKLWTIAISGRRSHSWRKQRWRRARDPIVAIR